MPLFPPGKGGDESVDYGYKSKEVTTHLLVDGNAMPLSTTVHRLWEVSEGRQIHCCVG